MTDPFVHYWRIMDPAARCGKRLTGPGQSMTTSTWEPFVTCPACKAAKPEAP